MFINDLGLEWFRHEKNGKKRGLSATLENKPGTYPEIGDSNFKGTLWTFKTVVSLKSVSALWNFYCSPINVLIQGTFEICSLGVFIQEKTHENWTKYSKRWIVHCDWIANLCTCVWHQFCCSYVHHPASNPYPHPQYFCISYLAHFWKRLKSNMKVV